MAKVRRSNWHQKSWAIILFLVVLPIAGVPLVWLSKWPQKTKIMASVAGVAWFLLTLLIHVEVRPSVRGTEAPKPAQAEQLK